MKATEFERRHPNLIRHALIAAAVGVYLFDRDDIVWRFVKNAPANRLLERASFLLATVLIGVGAALCTRVAALLQDESEFDYDPKSDALLRQRYYGEFVYAIGFASLMPLWGFVLLVCSEGLRILRLIAGERGSGGDAAVAGVIVAERDTRAPSVRWGHALRLQAAKWGIFVSMIVFTITLTDRLVEILICASALIWSFLNLLPFGKRQR